MLRLQQELNDATNGSGWEQGRTRHNKIIDWRRCIWLEAAELVESYPWKHWKHIDADPDWDNIRIEAVDIWHFVMSEALRIFSVEERGGIVDLAHIMTGTEAYRAFESGAGDVPDDPYGQIAEVEVMMGMLFDGSDVATWTAQFYRIALQSGLNLDALYRLYIGKNILNRFRQDHGYKAGTYTKTWHGREDNSVMQAILAKQPDMTPAQLYEALKHAYPAS